MDQKQDKIADQDAAEVSLPLILVLDTYRALTLSARLSHVPEHRAACQILAERIWDLSWRGGQ